MQGSGIGPASYVVNASDLRAVTPGNELLKFADDTHIIIPAVNASSRQAELDHIHELAQTNNLKANLNKYAEIVFVDNKRRRKLEIQPPPPLPNIHRVQWSNCGGTRGNGVPLPFLAEERRSPSLHDDSYP